jgi:class 3 adenylate cyclase
LVKPSTELEAISKLLADAVKKRDRATVESYFSRSAALRYLGSDDNEYWSGETVRTGYMDHIAEMPDYEMEIVALEAFENGETGWTIMIGKLTLEGVPGTVIFRTITVFALEDGVWKVVLAHSSTPQPNIEVIGREHRLLDQLTESAASEFNAIDPGEMQNTVTVMFTDVVNSTAIAGVLGDRAWTDLINSHFDEVSRIIALEHGHLVKTLGDGSMSTFASAKAGLSAAQAIPDFLKKSAAEPRLMVRIGVHTGEVMQSKGDFFGSVVNKAARITAAAGPSKVFVSKSVKTSIGEDNEFRFGPAMSAELKGITSPPTVYELIVQG